MSIHPSYTSQIAAPLTSSLKTRRSTTVTGEPFTTEVDGGTKVGIGGGSKAEVDGVEKSKRPSPNLMIFAKS